MRHANSNLNILKKNRNSKTIKLNNFLKPPSSSNNFNSPITTKNSNNKNLLYNLLYKDNSKISLYNTKNTTNTFKNINEISNVGVGGGGGKYSFSNKNLSNNSISTGNSLNYKDNKTKHSHINIRLKLNSKIINSNYNSKKKKSKQKSVNYDIIEKIKEKDSKINKLQKDLFQSQDLLNKLQKDKQRELNFTYNSMKSLDNLNIATKDYQISDFFIPTSEKNDRILKTNFNRFEMKKSKKKLINLNSKNKNSNSNLTLKKNSMNKNLKTLLKIDSLININSINNKNKRNNKYSSHISLSGFHKNSNSLNKYYYNFPTSNYLRCFSSSANRFFPRGHEQYESCISLTRTALKSKKKEKEKENNLSNKNQANLKSLSPFKNKVSSPSLKNLIAKCNLLKKKANTILSNYISLTEYIENLKK